jgi:uncharacterized protein involved in exopolysaccharide biosynthesis
MIDLYLDKHITAHRTPGTYEFFDKQAGQLRDQLSKTEEELKNLKKRTGLASLDKQRKIILERTGNLQKEREATQAAVAISRAKVQDLKGKLDGLSRTVVTTRMQSSSNYAVELTRGRLYELKLREQELLSKYKENSIPVQEVRRQITEAEAMLAKEEGTRTETTTGINTTYQQLNLDLNTEMADLSSLRPS